MPVRFGAASSSRRAKPLSKSRAIPNPVKTPPKTADCNSTKANWKAVYPLGNAKPGSLSTRESPPANAVKKKSVKISDGSSSDGFVSTLCNVRQATARATAKVLTAESPNSGRVDRSSQMAARAKPAQPDDGAASVASGPFHPHAQCPARCGHRDEGDRRGDSEAERQRLGVPARDDQAADALEQVRDRIGRGDVAEPLRLDQVPRDVHRGDEQEDEEDREEALHRLAGAGSERGEGAEAAEPETDDDGEQDDHKDACHARLQAHADRKADGEIDERLRDRQHDDAAELASKQRDPAHRRQREAAQEPGLDVAREVGAGVHGREQRALD